MKRQAGNVLSAVFFGVFVAPVVAIVWFVVPWLRDFPVGDDSPHGVGLPLGFCAGAALAVFLNRRFRWGRAAAVMGAIALAGALVFSLVAFREMRNIPGWEGLKWLVLLAAGLHAVVSAFGLLVSGLFSLWGRKVGEIGARHPESSPTA